MSSINGGAGMMEWDEQCVLDPGSPGKREAKGGTGWSLQAPARSSGCWRLLR